MAPGSWSDTQRSHSLYSAVHLERFSSVSSSHLCKPLISDLAEPLIVSITAGGQPLKGGHLLSPPDLLFAFVYGVSSMRRTREAEPSSFCSE